MTTRGLLFMKVRVPRVEFEKIFSRSSGPGGQNVNKLNSKVTIKLQSDQWRSAAWVPELARRKLLADNFKYLTKSGVIMVQSERSRSQAANINDCFEKLERALEEASWEPREASDSAQERWKMIQEREKRKLHQAKKFHKDKKSSRGRIE